MNPVVREAAELPKPKPIIYDGEEETDLTVLALKYKNGFKFTQPRPPSA